MSTFCLKCGSQLVEKIPNGDDKKRLVCESCGYINYNNPKPTITAIIEKDVIVGASHALSVLLIKRGKEPYKGCWAFIGGFVDSTETLDEAVSREVKEETGVNVIKTQYYFNYTDVYVNAADNNVSNNLGIHFLVTVDNTQPRPGNEELEVAWFNWDKLPENMAAFHDHVKVKEKRLRDLGII